GRALRSVSTSFPGLPMYDETEYVEIIKKKYPRLETNYFTPLDIDLLLELRQLLAIIKEPVIFGTDLLLYLMMRKAKELGIVNLITGGWADELIGGYDLFLLAKAYDDFKGFKLKEASVNLSEYMLRSKMARSFSWPKLIKDLSARGVKRSLLFFKPGIPDKKNICRSQKIAKAVGINFIMPYTDKRIVGLCGNLASERLICRGQTKVILKEAAADIVPEITLKRRQKFCCPAPEAVWLFKNKENIMRLEDRRLIKEYKRFLKKQERRYYEGLWLALSNACMPK
ncbi:MAG: asparagine synthase, partial [Candidatus Omnitrophica bacterium]|nr:asparagine synthase [Candidatus Omnitrophota bacterium]